MSDPHWELEEAHLAFERATAALPREVFAKCAVDLSIVKASLRRAAGEVDALDRRCREGRQLLRRMVKYVREDRAVTPGTTRLERLIAQVADYLERTHNPRDVLRDAQKETT